MPTECERSATSPTIVQVNATEIKDNLTTSTALHEDLLTQTIMEGDMSTSQTSTTSNGSSICNGGRKTSITSPDPTAYVAKARVTRPTPPPPPYNPMQFVQIKPCNLYQTAQEQLKKAEEVKKIKEIRKEEPEDWQNNLDNWKSSRRKRVEHIIDRVVEVKKLELEEHDRTRRKSKTFSEMIEERGERSGGRGLNKLASLAVYAEDEANDLSDLGIGTSSASGKSSLSEDYDNNSVMSDNAAELDKAIINNTENKPATIESTTREYISSPGYETSSSTAPASSPDPCEYTYEGAIQDYKQRVSRAVSGLTSACLNKLANSQQQNSKESTPERAFNKEAAYPPRRGSKIEDRLMGFEVQSPSEECIEKNKVDVPKIDISKRKEIFESCETHKSEPKCPLASVAGNNAGVPRVTLKERFNFQDSTVTLNEQPKKELKRMSGDITSIKERLQSLEQQQNLVNGSNGATKTTANKLVDIPVPPLKERLSSLQNAVTKEEVRKPPVVLVDARQLEIMKHEEEKAQQSLKVVKQEVKLVKDAIKESVKSSEKIITPQHPTDKTKCEEVEEIEEVDRNDSGIHTADDEEVEERIQADLIKKEQELQLNAAIEALAKEEKQLSEAANAVNQIEAEFEELSLGSVTLPSLSNNSNSSATPITNDHMEYSVSSTNPQMPCIFSHISSNKNRISQNSSSGNGTSSGSGSDTNAVQGLDFKKTSNLCRKPTNEMVHAKNLLKIFKETFQNDIELDEHEAIEEHETKNIKVDFKQKPDTSLNPTNKDFENCKIKTKEESIKPTLDASNSSQFLMTNDINTIAKTSHSPLSVSMIPRAMAPIGKPPMSPIPIRSTTKFVAATPPGSPSLSRKNDSQFSINGRVEIFNSKTMTSSTNSSVLVKPTTPTMTAKKSQLPYINAPKTLQSNNLVLPNHRKQQMSQEATTKEQQQQTITVIEPLSTTLLAATSSKNQQQQQQQHDEDEKTKQLKSMPSKQMVNEPQTNVDGETYHQHQLNHNNESVKQQQQQQQQSEVIVCAPPITIVNPDELPKPNTVKNLSSCFQQQPQQQQQQQKQQHHHQQKDNSNAKQIPPKPLPRTRIPQITPPLSPALPRRNICHKSETLTEALSNSSTGSSSRDSDKKLSKLSNILSTSKDVVPSVINTDAQVHREPKEKDKETVDIKNPQNFMEDSNKPAKILDKQSTQVLVQEMIGVDSEAHTLISNTKDPKANALTKRTQDTNTDPLTLEKIVLQNFKPNSPASQPSLNSLQPPLQPLKSNNFKTTTPLVVSTQNDKCQSTPLPPSNQRCDLASLKTTSKSIPHSVIIPAELPTLPDCLPNESTLYKLASSAPHSPVSLKSNSENSLAIDSAICNTLLTSLSVTPEVLQRQHTVEEDLYKKVDIDSLPYHQNPTGYKELSYSDIKHCDGLTPSAAHKLQASTHRQNTVEEESCQKLDISTLPDGKQLPITSYKCVSPTEIRKCDPFLPHGSEKPNLKFSSKSNSPIVEVRAAHSKALIETCEKIIAEERLTSSQMKYSLPSSPSGTPAMPRKSKIPKPIASCCKATESINEADLKPSNHSTSREEKNGAIARLHVVETQIKVTTSTPPASPKLDTNKPQTSTQATKKTKNIFDFLKKNFGVGAHKDESHEISAVENTVIPVQDNKILVLSEKELQDLEKLKDNEIHKFDNSKFYIPSSELNDNEMSIPPPLPRTPAPVNIEITRKIITDEILEDDKTEKDLTKEIDDLLDDELNKLNYEIQKLENADNRK